MRTRTSRSFPRLFLLTGILLVGCGRSDPPDRLVVMCGLSADRVASVWKRFEAETGLALDVRYGSDRELARQVVDEDFDTDVDVFWAAAAGTLAELGDRGLLAPLSAATTANVHAQFMDDERHWVGSSAHAQVLVYGSTTTAHELPRSLRDLSASSLARRFGWAPGDPLFETQVSGLRRLWGDEATQAWLAELASREPTNVGEQGTLVDAVSTGRLGLAWVDQVQALRAGEGLGRHSFPEPQDAGNLLMLRAVGVTAASEKTESAERFVQFMLSAAEQARWSEESLEYPARAGVPGPAGMPNLDTLNPPVVDPRALLDVDRTAVMLGRLGLR